MKNSIIRTDSLFFKTLPSVQLTLSTVSTNLKRLLPVNWPRLNKNYILALVSNHIIYSRSCFPSQTLSLLKNLFNNVVTASSFFSITTPESLGKLSMFNWFIRELAVEESFLVLALLLAGVILQIVALIGFYLIFKVYKKDNFFANEFIPYFKKLPKLKKTIIGIFTIFFAIPNKFWVNVNINTIFLFIISIILYFMCLVFPLLFFFYCAYLILCFESFIFGLLYEYSKYFKKSVNSLLFCRSDKTFAQKYFNWFWGNTYSKAGKVITTIGGTAVALEMQRQKENKEKHEYADKQSEMAVSKSEQNFKSPQEYADFNKARREEWVEENGTVTKIVKVGQDFVSSFFS